MTTRAGAAGTSRQVKQKLIKLLFDENNNKIKSATSSITRKQHRPTNSSFYSYENIRSAYLKRIQEIHPDKLVHQTEQNSNINSNFDNRRDGNNKNNDHTRKNSNIANQTAKSRLRIENEKFVELQNAWKAYDNIMKTMKRVNSNDKKSKDQTENYKDYEEANFTMFGVGCSFSDTPKEREYRNEIMDQACRGWFSSGSLSDESSTSVFNESKLGSKDNDSKKGISLCDDDLFITVNNDDIDTSGNNIDGTNLQDQTHKQKKCLIPKMGGRMKRDIH